MRRRARAPGGTGPPPGEPAPSSMWRTRPVALGCGGKSCKEFTQAIAAAANRKNHICLSAEPFWVPRVHVRTHSPSLCKGKRPHNKARGTIPPAAFGGEQLCKPLHTSNATRMIKTSSTAFTHTRPDAASSFATVTATNPSPNVRQFTARNLHTSPRPM